MTSATRKLLFRIGGIAVILAALLILGSIVYLVISAFMKVVLEIN